LRLELLHIPEVSHVCAQYPNLQDFNEKLEYFTDPLSYTLPAFNPRNMDQKKTQARHRDGMLKISWYNKTQVY
jgi:hypothetical protein